MKISDKDDNFAADCKQKIAKIFTHTECVSMAITLLGACDIMGRDLIGECEVKKFIKCSKKTQYGLLQTAQWYKILGQIIRDEVKERDELKLGYLPFGESSWKTDEDLEARMILLIKSLYNQYKEEGKICD